MADRSLRGMRLGAQSLQTEEGVTFSPRASYTYLCATCGQETVMIFSADAEAPDEWECKHCAHVATRLVDSKPVIVDHSDEKIARTPWDMLLERRTVPELEELLEERLAFLRARRGQRKVGA
ncbi:RNA polymerase-binding protein RbpA [Glaciibacter psychrotolerans]|uniref:RNA polymerase-binding protein RbpA n=1 Tax=Glaciibacter psychrotolerans TaxID=670054 RepID=A0A7Z0J5C0_9MICO|nr:RNA polymerase-binding protein RbpA [Leifsonia psychrotolerans]NYJ19297.1 DNA-directed RNA polymerase subunit RPC12/RpoP [Leifsonia psychrotolerans]